MKSLKLFQKEEQRSQAQLTDQVESSAACAAANKVPLRNKTWAKVVAIILLVVMASTAIASVVGIFGMIDEGIYIQTEEETRQEKRQNLADVIASDVLRRYLNKDIVGAMQTLEANQSAAGVAVAVYAISDNVDAGMHLLGTQTKEAYNTYWLIQESYGSIGMQSLHGAERTLIRPDAIVTVYFQENSMNHDQLYWSDLLVRVLYDLRYVIFFIAVLSFGLALASFVFLMQAAGHRPSDDQIHANWLTKMPADLLLGMEVLAGFLLWVLMYEGVQYRGGVFILAVGVVLALLLLVGASMDAAIRLKLGVQWKHTLLYWLGCHILRLGKKLGMVVGELFLSLPLIWKTVLLVGAAAGFEMCFVVMNLYEGHSLVAFTIIKLIILVPAVLLSALMMRRLQKGGEAIASGDLSYQIDTSHMVMDFKTHGEQLNHIGEGMAAAVEERLKSERMKTELITNVSHDIKTPLTSIINYSDLIGKEPCDNEKITEYAEVLHRQSERLKRLIEDLVEASKASTGNLEVLLAPCEVGVLLNQAAGEYEQRLQQCQLELVTKQPEMPVKIMADGRRLWRVFDNLLNNICKYSQPGTRVYITVEVLDGNAVIAFKNTSRDALNISSEELMERFVRGDAARKSEGNGLGLSIAKSLTDLQNGTMALTVDGDLFKVVLTFPMIKE